MWALKPTTAEHTHQPCRKLMAADLPGEQTVNLPRNAIPGDDRKRQP
jgi:hypothetical protein